MHNQKSKYGSKEHIKDKTLAADKMQNQKAKIWGFQVIKINDDGTSVGIFSKDEKNSQNHISSSKYEAIEENILLLIQQQLHPVLSSLRKQTFHVPENKHNVKEGLRS